MPCREDSSITNIIVIALGGNAEMEYYRAENALPPNAITIMLVMDESSRQGMQQVITYPNTFLHHHRQSTYIRTSLVPGSIRHLSAAPKRMDQRRSHRTHRSKAMLDIAVLKWEGEEVVEATRG